MAAPVGAPAVTALWRIASKGQSGGFPAEIGCASHTGEKIQPAYGEVALKMAQTTSVSGFTNLSRVLSRVRGEARGEEFSLFPLARMLSRIPPILS